MLWAVLAASSGLIPVTVVFALAFFAARHRLARRFGWRPLATVAAGTLLGAGLGLTLGPSAATVGGYGVGPAVNEVDCTLSASGSLGALDLPRLTSSSLNFLLFLPTAFFSFLAVRRFLPLLLLWAAVPVLIEAAQGLLSLLGRSCMLQDWIDNTSGALLGLAAGWAAERAWSRYRRRESAEEAVD